MEQQQVIGNKLIMEFLQLEKCTDEEHRDNPCYWHEADGEYFASDETKYHCLWNWLMPVVEQIEMTNRSVFIVYDTLWGNYCSIIYGVDRMKTDDTKAMGQGETKIEAVYNAVIEFCKWYNQNKTP